MTSGGGASYCLTTASSFLEKFAGIGDLAGHGRGGRGGRRAQIDGRLGVAHAPVEVAVGGAEADLSLIHISEPTRLGMISYAVFCLKKKKQKQTITQKD